MSSSFARAPTQAIPAGKVAMLVARFASADNADGAAGSRAQALQNLGATDMLIKAMMASANDVDLAAQCAQAITAITGASGGGVRTLIDTLYGHVGEVSIQNALTGAHGSA